MLGWRSIVMVALCLGVLISIVLPAILQVRQHARRTTVCNSLRQLALANLNYESAHMKFPTSGNSFLGNEKEFSFLFAIGPFLESRDWFGPVDCRREWDHPINAIPFSASHPSFLSPCEAYLRDENGFGLTHFAGSTHVFSRSRDSGATLGELDSSDILMGEVCENYSAWAAPGNSREANLSTIDDSLRFTSDSFGSPEFKVTAFAFVDGSVQFFESSHSRPDQRYEDTRNRKPAVKIDTASLGDARFRVKKIEAEARGFVRIARDKSIRSKESFRVWDSPLQSFDPQRFLGTMNLIGLDLYGYDLNDDGLQVLGRLDWLEILMMRCTNISEEGLGSLANAKSLRVLQLFGSELSPESVERLQMILPKCEIIVEN